MLEIKNNLIDSSDIMFFSLENSMWEFLNKIHKIIKE